MSEFSAPIKQEVIFNPNGYLLHNQTVMIEPESTPLADSPTTEAHFGIRGNLLAILQMPSEQEGQIGKRIGLIDFTEDFQGKPLIAALPGTVKITSRYALAGLNYSPDTHMFPYTPLKVNEMAALGNEDNWNDYKRPNYDLGLDRNQNIGNEAMSSQHASITVTSSGQVFVSDFSARGTILEINPKQKITVQ